ncbi:MAG: hypothetical protein FWG32_07170 [Oscillospiraceae bacterium]|nr:hypothetical protein [Oscillospiraceae bacterium]
MGKHDHLISYVPRPDRPDEKVDPNVMRKIAWMEDSFMKGAPYFEIMWFCSPREPRPPTHTHTFDEYIGFIGGDPDHPEDLNATVKFLLEDEWYTFTKSVVFFIPAGMPHSPIIIEEVKKPFIHFSGGPNVSYTRSE